MALQQKEVATSVGSAEHKFLEAKHEMIGRVLLDALKGEADCMKVDTYDVCQNRFKPIVDKIEAQGDLVMAQLTKVDECKKIYRATIDKRTSDLTVRESTAVKACQALALYPLEMPAKQKE